MVIAWEICCPLSRSTNRVVISDYEFIAVWVMRCCIKMMSECIDVILNSTHQHYSHPSLSNTLLLYSIYSYPFSQTHYASYTHSPPSPAKNLPSYSPYLNSQPLTTFSPNPIAILTSSLWVISLFSFDIVSCYLLCICCLRMLMSWFIVLTFILKLFYLNKLLLVKMSKSFLKRL